jgi:antitoxin HicB
MSDNKHIGSSFESFLEEEGIYEEVDKNVNRRMLAEQIRSLMKRRKVTPTVLATRMSTSRTAVYRLLEAEEGTTLGSLERASNALGAHLVVKIVADAQHRALTQGGRQVAFRKSAKAGRSRRASAG